MFLFSAMAAQFLVGAILYLIAFLLGTVATLIVGIHDIEHGNRDFGIVITVLGGLGIGVPLAGTVGLILAIISCFQRRRTGCGAAMICILVLKIVIVLAICLTFVIAGAGLGALLQSSTLY